MKFIYPLAFGVSCLAMPFSASAQNTSGVHSPVVKEGERSLAYRLGINPENANGDFRYAQQFHYQQAINGDFRWRVRTQFRNTSRSDFDLNYVQAELLWELSDDDDQHKTGLRFDARIRDDNRPEQFGLNWTNRFNFSNGWSARALFIGSVQTGDNARDGVNLSTRARISKSLEGSHTIGVDMFSTYGNTGSIGSFSEQSHVIGPFISTPVTDNVSILVGSLFGISEAAPDVDTRLWISRKF